MEAPRVQPRQIRTSGPQNDVTALAAKAGAGDRHAFEALVHEFREAIFHMVYCRTHSAMD
ncbi:MAG: hypothetical protein JRI36_14285, partial [Deltaproteobacteria bacterium]|nr:hypothetical protein [Deltaproteobacteria bacterium]